MPGLYNDNSHDQLFDLPVDTYTLGSPATIL